MKTSFLKKHPLLSSKRKGERTNLIRAISVLNKAKESPSDNTVKVFIGTGTVVIKGVNIAKGHEVIGGADPHHGSSGHAYPVDNFVVRAKPAQPVKQMVLLRQQQQARAKEIQRYVEGSNIDTQRALETLRSEPSEAAQEFYRTINI